MEEDKEKEFQEKLTDSQLDALYFYIAMNADSMSEEESQMWKDILSKLDSKFYEY